MTQLDGRLLVVGGSGFVGSNLVRRALSDGAERVVVVDNLLSSERENLPDDPRLELREGSIADDAVLDGVADEFDTVFHLATYHGNQSSIADPLADHDNNLVTTLKLFDRLSGFSHLRRVVYAASGCALAGHDGVGPEGVVERDEATLDLDSPYQISKVVGEMYALYYRRAHGLPVVRARFQNVYGPGEVLGAGRWRGTPATVWRNVVPTFVYRALKGQPLTVHGDGSDSRDFVYVGDLVEGLVRCAVTPGVEGEAFNIASGVETTVAELAGLVNGLTGNAAGVESLPRREWDRSHNRFGSTAKSRERLGFQAAVPIGTGLAETVGWTKQELPRIEGCIARHRAHHPVAF